MSTPAVSPDIFKPSPFTKRLVYAIAVASAVVAGPFLLWPALAVRLFGSDDYLPHVFCYLRRPALVWTHVTADSLITEQDRKSTRLNSSHQIISYAVFCLKKKKQMHANHQLA